MLQLARRPLVPTLVTLLVLGAIACGGGDPLPDAAPDATVDAMADAAADATVDAEPDAAFDASVTHVVTIVVDDDGGGEDRPAIAYGIAGVGGGECAATCLVRVPHGAEVAFVASPPESFLGWKNACTGWDTLCELTVTSDVVVTGWFGPL
jgi:hypothetical protein